MSHDDWKAEDYTTHESYVPALTRQVLEDLAPRRGECILDLGCGDGVLTGVIQRHGATVVGIDGSAGLVAAARDRGIDARIGDAQDMTFDGRVRCRRMQPARPSHPPADGYEGMVRYFLQRNPVRSFPRRAP